MDSNAPVAESLQDREKRYLNMVRNLKPEDIRRIESSEILDDPWLCERQKLFRSNLAERTGVHFGEQSGELMRHPV